MIVLGTPRLSLRKITSNDLDFLSAMLGDPETMRFYPQVLDREGAQRWLERALQRYESDGHGFWLVVDKASGEPRGQIGVLLQNVEGKPLIEVGYMVHRPFWRQGIAAEAAAACRDWAFANLPVDAVHSLIRPLNLPSQAVARKIGMRPLPRMVEFHSLEHHLFQIARDRSQDGCA